MTCPALCNCLRRSGSLVMRRRCYGRPANLSEKIAKTQRSPSRTLRDLCVLEICSCRYAGREQLLRCLSVRQLGWAIRNARPAPAAFRRLPARPGNRDKPAGPARPPVTAARRKMRKVELIATGRKVELAAAAAFPASSPRKRGPRRLGPRFRGDDATGDRSIIRPYGMRRSLPGLGIGIGPPCDRQPCRSPLPRP